MALKLRQQLARHVAMIHPTRSDQPRQGDAKLVPHKEQARANSYEPMCVVPHLRTGTGKIKQLIITDDIESKTIVGRYFRSVTVNALTKRNKISIH